MSNHGDGPWKICSIIDELPHLDLCDLNSATIMTNTLNHHQLGQNNFAKKHERSPAKCVRIYTGPLYWKYVSKFTLNFLSMLTFIYQMMLMEFLNFLSFQKLKWIIFIMLMLPTHTQHPSVSQLATIGTWWHQLNKTSIFGNSWENFCSSPNISEAVSVGWTAPRESSKLKTQPMSPASGDKGRIVQQWITTNLAVPSDNITRKESSRKQTILSVLSTSFVHNIVSEELNTRLNNLGGWHCDGTVISYDINPVPFLRWIGFPGGPTVGGASPRHTPVREVGPLNPWSGARETLSFQPLAGRTIETWGLPSYQGQGQFKLPDTKCTLYCAKSISIKGLEQGISATTSPLTDKKISADWNLWLWNGLTKPAELLHTWNQFLLCSNNY